MPKRIIILGAGVAGAQALKHIHRVVHDFGDAQITVIDKNNYSTFAPMLHEAATGALFFEHLTHPVRQIVACCLERFYQGAVEKVDLKKKTVHANGDTFTYDYLVLALGAKTNYFNIPGAEKHALPLKTMTDAVRLRAVLIDTFEQATKLPKGKAREHLLHFVIVGGGYTGVELAGQIADLFSDEFCELYPEIDAQEARITLIQAGERILPTLSPKSSKKGEQRLKKLGVSIICGKRVVEVKEGQVILDDKSSIAAQHIIWSSGVLAVGQELFPESMLEKGRVKVKSTLQISEHDDVFVLGDLAAVMEGNGPHPQAAQVAFLQAKTVARNIVHHMQGRPLERFFYQHRGDLVPIGNRFAIGEIRGMHLTGFFAWWLRRTIYLSGVFSWSDRIRIIFDWTMKLFTKRDTTRL